MSLSSKCSLVLLMVGEGSFRMIIESQNYFVFAAGISD